MNPPLARRALTTLAATVLLALPAAGSAVEGAVSTPTTPPSGDGFSTTNLQLLQGWGFHDNELGYDTRTGGVQNQNEGFLQSLIGVAGFPHSSRGVRADV